jgi:hypothetical protein
MGQVVDASAATASGRATGCSVVELRHYTLHPRQRDTLIALFEREFIESQEAVGNQVIAQFRDIDRPDVFTWLRGFADMPARAAALAAFYDGPAWRAHRDAANATMIDSDDVRLLRPARPGSGVVLDGAERPGRSATTIPATLFTATIYTLTAPAAEGFTDVFERSVVPELIASGARPIAMLETEPRANNYPRLPVREGEHALVWFARFADVSAHDHHMQALEGSQHWRTTVRPALDRHLRAPAEVWRLVPTARSQLLV